MLRQEDVQLIRSGAFKKPLVAFSGGKDSVFLSELIRHHRDMDYAAVISEELEYSMHINFMKEYSKRVGINLIFIETGFGFDWLDKHPEFILPTTSKIKSKIFKLVQQDHIRRYAEKNGYDCVIFGRRTADGNSIKAKLYTTKNGIQQYFPVKDYPDIAVTNFLCESYVLSPIYKHCDGFYRGTHTINICNAYGDQPRGKRLKYFEQFEPEKYRRIMELIRKHNINID